MKQHRDAIGAVLVDRDMSIDEALSILGLMASDFIRYCPPDMRMRLAKKFGDLVARDVRRSFL